MLMVILLCFSLKVADVSLSESGHLVPWWLTSHTKRERHMKSLLIIPLVLLALLAPLNACADGEKGVAAQLSGDYATAAKEYKKAAEQDNAIAQNNLGFMYRNGKGVLQDDKEAVKWYRLAAEQGSTNA
jgi:tetratricopeptide (TPR) repeat protein